MIGDGEREGQGDMADPHRSEHLDCVETQEGGPLGEEVRLVRQEEVDAGWDDQLEPPRWHAGQTITGRECRDRACGRPHWTLHGEAPLRLRTGPTTAEALRSASEEMRYQP